MLREFVTLIATRTGLTIGTDLFAGWRPQKAPDDCTVIIESGGKRQYWTETVSERRLQALTRASSYATARDQAELIRGAIAGVGNAGRRLTALASGDPDWIVCSCEEIDGPQWIGVDDQGRHEFSINYLLKVEEV